MSVLIKKLMACFEGEDWWSQFVELENELPGFWSCVGPFCRLATQLSNSIPAMRVRWETLDGPALATFKEFVAFLADQKVVTFTTTCHEPNWEPDSMSITCDEVCIFCGIASAAPFLEMAFTAIHGIQSPQLENVTAVHFSPWVELLIYKF